MVRFKELKVIGLLAGVEMWIWPDLDRRSSVFEPRWKFSIAAFSIISGGITLFRQIDMGKQE